MRALARALADLPHDALVALLARLPWAHRLALSGVSRALRRAYLDPCLWHALTLNGGEPFGLLRCARWAAVREVRVSGRADGAPLSEHLVHALASSPPRVAVRFEDVIRLLQNNNSSHNCPFLEHPSQKSCQLLVSRSHLRRAHRRRFSLTPTDASVFSRSARPTPHPQPARTLRKSCCAPLPHLGSPSPYTLDSRTFSRPP